MNNWQLRPLKECGDEFWQQWHDLHQSYHSHNPMLDVSFVKAIVSCFPEDILVAKGFSDNDLAAIVLLQKTGSGSWSNYLPSQSQVALILQAPDYQFNLATLFAALGVTSYKLDLFSLDPQEHSKIIASADMTQSYAENIKLQIDGDFQQYWSARPKRLRKDMAKVLNRLAKDQLELTLEVTTDCEGMRAAVDRYGMLEAQGWKGKQGTAIHPANQQGQFYQYLLEQFAQKQNALVFENYLGDRLVASRLCIFNQHTLIILKTTFDESMSYYGLGNLNRYQLIEYLFSQRLSRCVDFYTNASKEQLYWATEQRTMVNASFYRFSVLGKVVNWIGNIKRYLHKDM